jgi:hypothetical protein
VAINALFAGDSGTGEHIVGRDFKARTRQRPVTRLQPRLLSGPTRVIATLTGFAVAALVVALLAAPGGASHARAAASASASTHQQGGMAGMNMSDLPPAVPKLAASSPCTATACPIAKPGPDELAVADRLGSAMAAAWVTRDGGRVHARVELLNLDLGPVREPTTFGGNPARQPCGPGCWLLTLPAAQTQLTIAARENGRRYVVSLPLRWEHGRSAGARALVDEAVQSMSALIGVRLEERLATGTPGTPGSSDDIHFQLSAPNAMSATVTGQSERQVTIGPTQWTYTPGVGWVTSTYSDNGSNDFSTASLFSWHQDEQSAQLLSEVGHGGDTVAVIALMNPQVPAWLRLTVDTRTGLVQRVNLVTEGKFTDQRFFDYGAAQVIRPPNG